MAKPKNVPEQVKDFLELAPILNFLELDLRLNFLELDPILNFLELNLLLNFLELDLDMDFLELDFVLIALLGIQALALESFAVFPRRNKFGPESKL